MDSEEGHDESCKFCSYPLSFYVLQVEWKWNYLEMELFKNGMVLTPKKKKEKKKK